MPTDVPSHAGETGVASARFRVMPYELRTAGRPAEQYETPEEAEARARDLIRSDADLQVEVIDLTTGRPYAPAAGVKDREHLARKVGF